MIAPYGGELIDRVISNQAFDERFDSSRGVRVRLGQNDLTNLTNLALGHYSPLVGFMTEEEYSGVLNDLCLPQGELNWTVPIILSVEEHKKEEITSGQAILLEDEQGEVVGALQVSDVFKIDLRDHAEKVFQTTNEEHPGVQNVFRMIPYCVGGEVFVPERGIPNYRSFKSPKQNRAWLEERGLRQVTAFSTRNICHVGHEYLHTIGLEISDVLGINVITGTQLKGSFLPEVVFDTYEYLIDCFYPPERVFLNNLRMPPFYAGPKEAFLQAVMLQNLGFSHFIVGRDHAGVGNFYPRYGSQEIFEELNLVDIQILPISEPRYCSVCEKVTTEKSCRHSGSQIRELNGTDVRRYLLERRYADLRYILRKELQDFVTRMAEQQAEFDGNNVKVTQPRQIFYE